MTNETEGSVWDDPPKGADFSFRLPEIPRQADVDAIDAGEVDAALRAVVHDSLLPVTTGLSIVFMVNMVLHLIFVSMPYAAYISFLAAATAVGALLLRLLLQTISSEHVRMHAVSGSVGAVVLVHVLATQVITGNIPLMQLTMCIVGAGVVMMSRTWFIAFVSSAILTWGILSLFMVPVSTLVIPGTSVAAAAAFSSMIHVVRRRTNVRAEQLRQISQRQKRALQEALTSEERQRASLSQSQADLKDTMRDLRSAKEKVELREKELSETVEALKKAKKQAEESSRIKSAMLANMSHEVRTPLTAIIGFGDVLTEELTGETERFAQLIVKSSHRLMKTLNSVLKLSRLEANKVELDYERIDLVEEARSILLEQSNRSEQAGVQLELQAIAPTCWCNVDVGAIQRILRNLVGNAIKFTAGGGGVTVRVGHCGHPPTDREAVRSGGQVHVLDDRPERADYAVLQIEDDGIGMSAEFQKDMFEAFHQESQGLNRSHEGSGLGLSITKRLVALLGGDIYVESTKGEGTTFTLYLPKNDFKDAINPTGDGSASSASAETSPSSVYSLQTEATAS